MSGYNVCFRDFQQALLAEQRRCSTYLHRSSALKLQKMVLEATLGQKQIQLLHKETAIEFLLTNDRRPELRQAHRLFSFVQGGVEQIALTFKKFVSDRGNKVRHCCTSAADVGNGQ